MIYNLYLGIIRVYYNGCLFHLFWKLNFFISNSRNIFFGQKPNSCLRIQLVVIFINHYKSNNNNNKSTRPTFLDKYLFLHHFCTAIKTNGYVIFALLFSAPNPPLDIFAQYPFVANTAVRLTFMNTEKIHFYEMKREITAG